MNPDPNPNPNRNNPSNLSDAIILLNKRSDRVACTCLLGAHAQYIDLKT